MQRLLMGEVGSGKTVVALYALLRAVEHGYQGGADGADRDARRAALRDDPVADAGGGWSRVGLLTGSTPARRARRPAGQARERRAVAVVGTHALIEDDGARSRGSAVAVVDEQHRFGVRQRAALDAKGAGGDASSARTCCT